MGRTASRAAALEAVVDPAGSGESRTHAATELGLDPSAYYRVIALPGSADVDGDSSTATTAAGRVRFAVRGLADALPGTRSGVGLATLPNALPRSWSSALLALRLTSRLHPVVRADEIGALLILVEAADAVTSDSADLTALKFLLRSQPKALGVLELLAATANLRDVSSATGLHLDTIKQRARDYLAALGFDVLTAKGRTRLALALALFRLQTNRFE